MRRFVLAILAVLLVGAIVALVRYHHDTGARFQGVAVPEPEAAPRCVAMMTNYGYGEGGARSVCRAGAKAAWFRVTVRNVGHRGAWLKTCRLTGYTDSGDAVLHGVVTTGPLNGLAGPYLESGQSVGWTWFLMSSDVDAAVSVAPNDSAHTFAVACEPVDYHGHIPT